MTLWKCPETVNRLKLDMSLPRTSTLRDVDDGVVMEALTIDKGWLLMCNRVQGVEMMVNTMRINDNQEANGDYAFGYLLVFVQCCL